MQTLLRSPLHDVIFGSMAPFWERSSKQLRKWGSLPTLDVNVSACGVPVSQPCDEPATSPGP